ncbi:MAG: phosphoribosylformylglycinamidine synthase I [candidate division WOR-3 bacterium]
MVKACVLFAAGTNCDVETCHALELAGAKPERVHINQFKSGERNLAEFQLLVIPGGFSYGDYISSGRILANELKYYLAEDIERFCKQGKPILGICNGFQVLVKAGLLPGFERPFEPQTVTLDTNNSGRFEDRWVFLRTEPSRCIFTQGLPEVCELPVAHAEGKFITANEGVLKKLNDNRQVVFRYVSRYGEAAEYPDNPNGSVEDIAGICDPSGIVFGLMPHPERYTRPEHHPEWHRWSARTRTPSELTRPQGIRIFENAVRHAQTI